MAAVGAMRTELPRLTNRLSLGSDELRVSPACLGMVDTNGRLLCV